MLRRLITLLLCLWATSGAITGNAVVGAPSAFAGVQSPALSPLSVQASVQFPALEHAWNGPVPLVVAPPGGNRIPHVDRGLAGIRTVATTSVAAQNAATDQATRFDFASSVDRRGYRATGPPGMVMTPLFISLARPA